MELDSHRNYIPELVLDYAGFWLRFLAYLIDGFLLLVAGYAISQLIADEIFLSIIELVGTAFYYIGLESSERQATLGKSLLGLKVVNYEGGRISTSQAAIRYFGKILSTLILLIGYLMVAFTEKKQGLHDLLAKTYVIREKGNPNQPNQMA